MANDYYEQSARRPATMTVAQLIERLKQQNPDSPVIFRSPEHGCFGPEHSYSVDDVWHEALDRREEHIPGGTGTDEETGEPYSYEPSTEVFEAWSGVVIG